MKKKILLVGFGQMGAAIAQGLLAKGWPTDHLTALDPTPQAQARAGLMNIACTATYDGASADVILLAIKPQMMAEACAPLQAVAKNALIISIAAGITLARLTELLGEGPKVRAMPNLPAAIGESITACVTSAQTTLEQQDTAQAILQAIGDVCWLDDEDLMNTVTAVSGSGPAYFFLLMEALEEAAMAEGLPADLARILVTKTAAGAGAMAWQRHLHHSPAEQRVAVTSPGGTTEAALKILTENDFKEAIKKAVHAARQRGEDLAK